MSATGTARRFRDKALLLTAFASGGRRRSEIAGLRLEQIFREPPVPLDPADPRSEALPCLSIVLGRTKTGSADEDSRVLLIGPPVLALQAWIAKAGISKGAVFRAIDRWGTLQDKALTPQAVNLIVKARCIQAGLDPVRLQRPWPALGLFDGSRATRRADARSHAPIAASLGAAGGALLQ